MLSFLQRDLFSLKPSSDDKRSCVSKGKSEVSILSNFVLLRLSFLKLLFSLWTQVAVTQLPWVHNTHMLTKRNYQFQFVQDDTCLPFYSCHHVASTILVLTAHGERRTRRDLSSLSILSLFPHLCFYYFISIFI